MLNASGNARPSTKLDNANSPVDADVSSSASNHSQASNATGP